MKIIFALILVVAATAYAFNTPTVINGDPGLSGSITSSGSIGITNTQNRFKIGYEIIAVASGTVGSPVAALQGSNDCVNFTTLPIRATGDATKTVTIGGGSGTYFLSEDNLEVNCAQIRYTGVTGGGTMILTEIRKVHDALK